MPTFLPNLSAMGADLFSNVVLVTANFVVALLIGATAIGGLLLAPGLDVIGGVPIHVAIPSCMFAIIFTGIVGAIIFGRNNAIDLADFLTLTAGAGMAAFAGSFALVHIPAAVVQAAIAALCIASGLHAISNRQRNRAGRPCSRTALVCVGAVTGFGSAITGTGGPLILVPIMLALGTDLRQTIGLAQAIQIPIGILATAGNLMMDRVVMEIALPITVIVVVGAAIGASLAQRFSTRVLRLFVAGLLVVAGAGYLYKAI